MLDIKLDTLLTVYEEKNFTKAAQKLNLTQPAVSNHIRMLETEIGHPLCVRTKGKLLFTPEGEIAVSYAKLFKTIYTNMCEEIAEKQTAPTPLKIGMTRSLEGDPIIANTIAQYITLHSNNNLKVISGTIHSLCEMLKNYELDFIIIDASVPGNSQFTSHTLDTESLLCFVCTSNPLASKSRIRLEELKKEPMVMWLPSSTNRILFESALESIQESLDQFNVILETDSLSTIKLLVSKDAAVSIIPHRFSIKRSKYTGIPIEGINMVREINLISRKGFPHKTILDEFIQIYHKNVEANAIF